MKLNVIQPYKLAPIVAIHLCCMTAYAQTDTSTINQLEQAQFEQRKDLIKQNINEPQVNLQTDIQSINNTLPANEKPCFIIDTIRIDVDADYLNKFKGILKPITQGSNSIIGQCIGQQGLSYIADQVQNEILKKGYITTRVSIPEQDLNSKVLTLKIVPGLYKNVWLSNDSDKDVNTYNAITMKTGDILNLRELETSLENFRLPQTSTTSIDIIPSIEGVTSEAYGI
ncbi:ShlB/FhaC/HecB family hemolysin secretion/activation protein, partial [Psychrobacter phenylpyruvicus]